ncbi:MAG: glycine cleavage system aminomethyltransferase GcvT [Ruthenibacterium sp.]
MEKKTPLYEEHLAQNGRIVPFAGYLLPVQYETGVITEHMAVREHAGIFDVSHMGEAILEGPDALSNLNYILTNSFTDLKCGAARYTLMLYENAGQVDDLIVYRMGEEKFFLVLNAANTEKDLAWLKEHLTGNVTLTDLSDNTAQIALQGPDSKAILGRFCNADELPQKNYTFTQCMQVAGVSCLVSRTGYTGEFGYELYMKPSDAVTVWNAFLKAGALPCGLGCRDTLRLEAAMPLYGHELSADTPPMATGLSFAIKLDKGDFIGKSAMLAQGQPARLRVGLKVTGRGIVREHEAVLLPGQEGKAGKEIGITTSGTHCPSLGVGCAMAYLDRAYCEAGTAVEVSVRGRLVCAEVVPLPFYKRAPAL